MPSETDKNEMLKRLRALEEENARLRRATGNQTPNGVVVREGEYNRYPTLTFEGPFRTFTLGVKKLTILKQVWPEVESFLEKHTSKTINNKHKTQDYSKI